MMLELPVMKCDPDCGACCGPVFCSDREYRDVEQHIREHGVKAKRQGPDVCPFYQAGKCAVYESRPIACQLFGHVPAMTCCKGYNVNISPRHERRIMKRIGDSREGGTRLLHEFAYGDDAFRLVADHIERQR